MKFFLNDGFLMASKHLGFLIYILCFLATQTGLAQTAGKAPSAEVLKRNYKIQFAGGTALCAAGITFMSLGVYLTDQKVPEVTYGVVTFPGEQDNNKVSTVSLLGGMVCTGAGLFIISRGIKNRSRYLESFAVTPTSAIFIINF